MKRMVMEEDGEEAEGVGVVEVGLKKRVKNGQSAEAREESSGILLRIWHSAREEYKLCLLSTSSLQHVGKEGDVFK